MHLVIDSCSGARDVVNVARDGERDVLSPIIVIHGTPTSDHRANERRASIDLRSICAADPRSHSLLFDDPRAKIAKIFAEIQRAAVTDRSFESRASGGPIDSKEIVMQAIVKMGGLCRWRCSYR